MSHSIEEFKTEFIKYIEKKYHKKWLIAVEKKRVFSLVLATALAYLEPISAVGRKMADSLHVVWTLGITFWSLQIWKTYSACTQQTYCICDIFWP